MPVFVLAALLAIQGIAAPTGVVTGRIRLANGTPAVGIRVSAMLSSDGARSDAADAGALFSQTQTDEAGRYRLEGIPPGRYYIMAGRVDAPTFYPGKEDVLAATAISVAASKPVDGIDFTMTAASAQPPNPAFGGLVGGTFYLNGTPEISVPVRFRGENGNRIPLMSPQGRTQLSAKSAAGGVQTLSRGQPAIVQTDGTAILKTPAGTYQFAADNLPQDYEVKSMTVGSVDLLRSPFQLNGPLAAEIDVVLGLKNPAPRRTGRTVSGQIVDGLSSKPWLAEAVYISGSPGTVFSDGTFEFLSVNPGRYTLEAREGAPGDRTAQTSVVVGGADVKIDLAYTSVPTYVRVTGRIIVESGNTPRLGNARIVMRNTGTPIAIAADGNFKSALSEGNYVLSVQDLPPGYAVKSIMTPEDLNRTIEFIIKSQGRLAAAQEQDREDRIKFEEWSKDLVAEMAADRKRMIEMLDIQSRRLDRAEQEDRAAQKRHDQVMQEIRKIKDRRN